MIAAPRSRPRVPHRRGQESGATLVEYALLVAVLALGTIASITTLQDTAEAQIDSTATHIGSRRSAVTTTPPPPSGGGGGTPTTVTPSTTTTTTPTTTTPPPPPTTAPPTTAPPTTAPPTTAPPSTLVRSTWGEPVSTRNGNQWNATVSLDILDDNDAPVSQATVTVTIEQRKENGGWQPLAAPFDAVTTASGGLVVTTPNVARTGKNKIIEMRLSVLAVDASGLTWEPQTVVVVATRP